VKVDGPCGFLDVGVEADTIERQGSRRTGEGFWAASDREQIQGVWQGLRVRR